METPIDHYELTFVRHGQSEGNANGYFQGQEDFPMTEKGKEQARLLGERWLAEGVQYDLAVSSPQARAKETAQIICGLLKVPLGFDPVWNARDTGKIAGLKQEEALKTFPHPDFINLFDRIGDKGESAWEFYLRAGEALKRIIQRNPGRYLIVSHAGLLNKMVRAILGIKPISDISGLRVAFANSAFAKFSFHPEKNRWEVFAINDHHHLPHPIFHPSQLQFTFLRHGESTGNIEGRFQGQKDFPLTDAGRSQAELLAGRWAAEGILFDRIVASPLGRALETAEIIGRKLGIKVEQDPVWKEVHNGKIAGLTEDEVLQQGTERIDHINMFNPIGETGESWWELYLRMGSALQRLMMKEPGHTLVVSHGGALILLMHNILGIHPGAFPQTPVLHFGNTGFSRAGYDPERDLWHLSALGDTAHLNKNNR
jgi:probable phosphoglycerate mutase